MTQFIDHGVPHSFNLVCEHGALPLSLFRGGIGPLGCRAPFWPLRVLVQARGYAADQASARGTQAGLQRATRLLRDPGAQWMGGNVELSADLGMHEFLFCNKLDGFSFELGGEGTKGIRFMVTPDKLIK